MHTRTPLAMAGAVIVAATAVSIGPATAAIKCQGNYQVVQGQLIGTPYCRDNNLAYVANKYGIKVSAHAVRQNPGVKRDVCSAIGHDNRVSEACMGYRPQDQGRRVIP